MRAKDRGPLHVQEAVPVCRPLEQAERPLHEKKKNNKIKIGERNNALGRRELDSQPFQSLPNQTNTMPATDLKTTRQELRVLLRPVGLFN